MYLPETRQGRPIESVDDLVEYFRAACKPRSQWRIGTEHEMIGVYRSGPERTAPVPYHGPRGIAVLLERMTHAGWTPIREGENIIALARGEAQITLEPGGQLELAAAPHVATQEFQAEIEEYVASIAEVSRELDIAWLSIGFRPWGAIDDVPWVPKGRYAVMRDYLPTRGRLAHEMMKRTATVQVSVDFSDEEDAAAKLRCAMSVGPLLTALYANSPIVDGRISGYQSYRARIWQETDPDRCGLLPFAFEDGDVFRAYAEWALDVPMFFVHRGGYRPAGGMTFRRFLREGVDGERATVDDWALHLSTLFPEARFKRLMEVRGCDAGSRPMILALGPLCRALFYDDDARARATELTASLSLDERRALMIDVARLGLAAPVGATGHTAGDLVRELVAIADDGLSRVCPREHAYLEPVREIAATGRTQADSVVSLWSSCNGDPGCVIPRLAYPGLGGEEPSCP